MKKTKDLKRNERNLKNLKKVFTKNVEKDIIIKKNNFFIANNKKYLRKKGLLMEKPENISLNEVKNKLNWKEKIIVGIFNNTFDKVTNLVRINTVNKMIK